jgi:hypothetical protein
MILSTEALVTDVPDRSPAGAGAPGGGDMYG